MSKTLTAATFTGFIVLAVCRAQEPAVPEGPIATFGTTVVGSSGLRGEIYYIPPNSSAIPSFDNLWPVGNIYTSSLNIQPRRFSQGFPGVTTRFERFAIDYKGKFWIEQPGRYWFGLISDDGSRLYIDDWMVVNNDGVHGPIAQQGSIPLNTGIHKIRVSYFQGPRDSVALVLGVAPPRQDWRIFSTDDFKPPPDSEYWKTAKPGDLNPDSIEPRHVPGK